MPKLCGIVFDQSSPVHPFQNPGEGNTSVTKEGQTKDKQRPEILVSNIGSMHMDEYSKVQRAARAYFKLLRRASAFNKGLFWSFPNNSNPHDKEK